MNTPPVISVPSYLNPLDNLRDRSEGTARTLCIIFGIISLIALMCAGGIGFIILLGAFFGWILTYFLAAQIKGGAVLISPQSWPELHAIVEEAKSKLGVADAKAYVLQDNAFNAFATRFAGRNFIVLNSGAVDTLLRKGKIEDLKFLVGHECGHVATPVRAATLTSLAQLRLAQGRAAEALSVARAADAFWRGFDPANRAAGEAARWLGRVQLALGQRTQGRATFARAGNVLAHSTLPPGNPMATDRPSAK